MITPNPNIPCKPGWCLAYVNEAFGVEKRFGTATAAWNGSETKHYDRDFPAGVWLPVWYALANEPAGHVVLLAPDGSCWSTSDPSTIPRHHPNLANLEWYYAKYGQALTYRGWTEDVEGTPVITLEEEDMIVDVNPVQAEAIAARAAELVIAALNGKMLINRGQADDIALRAASVTLEHMPDVSAEVVKEIKDKISGLSFEVVSK